MIRQIKILQVLDYLDYNSGVSSVVMNYYSHMQDTKFKIDFLLYKKPDMEYCNILSSHNSEAFELCKPSGKNIIKYRRKAKDFFRTKGREYDIVHIHVPNNAFIILYYAKLSGVPIRIIHSHNSKGADGITKRIRNCILNKWGIRYATHLFACSLKAGQSLYGRKNMNRVQIIYNAIDLHKYIFDKEKKKKIRTRYNLDNELVIIHVGRFAKQKNQIFLLQIARIMKERGVKFKLLFLGDGPLKAKLQNEARKMNLIGEIEFVGVVNNVEDYLSAADIFLLPSLYEGLPVVCVEAQVSGLNCILSNNITKEIQLTDKVKFLDTNRINDWIKEILSSAKIKERNMVLQQFDKYDIEVQAEKLEERYIEYAMGSNINVNL